MTGRADRVVREVDHDRLTYDLGAVRYPISVVGADRVSLGTDQPHQVDAVRSLRQ